MVSAYVGFKSIHGSKCTTAFIVAAWYAYIGYVAMQSIMAYIQSDMQCLILTNVAVKQS